MSFPRRLSSALPLPRAGGRLAALLALSACGGVGEDPRLAFPEVSALAPASVQVHSTTAVGEVLVQAVVVNSFGAAVPAGLLTIELSGAALEGGQQALTLAPGASGVLRARVPAIGTGAVEVRVVSSEDGADLSAATATAWVVGGDALPFKVSPSAALPELDAAPSHAAAGAAGVAFVSADQVWFQPADPAQAPYPVLDMPVEITDLQAAHIDRDGVLDLVVWAGNFAAALRGLPEGGYTWQRGWQAGFGAIAGVAVADVDSDRRTDIVLAATSDAETQVVVHHGDGDWAFEPGLPLIINAEVYDITAADEGEDGTPEISAVSVASGTIRRFTEGPDGWVGAKTSELPGYTADPGSTLLPAADLTGDRTFETVLVGSPQANTQSIVIFEIEPEGSGSINYPVPLPPLFANLADVDLDGAPDVIASVDGELHVLSFDGQGFVDRRSDELGPRGPVAGGEWVRGGVPDIAVVSDAVDLHIGRLGEEGEWDRERFTWRSYNTALTGPAVFTDVTSDGIADIVGFTTDSDLVVAAWSVNLLETGEGQLQFLGRTPDEALGTAAIPLDLVRCDRDFYALTDGSGGARLTRVRLTDGVPEVLGSVEATGVMLACGLIETGEEGVVVATQTGFWTSFAAGLGRRGEGEVGAVGDIALADLDGDGLGEVVGCAEEGCGVVAVDPDGDGADAVLRTGPSGATVSAPSGERTVAGAGLPAVGDVDGDGVLDVLSWDADAGRGALWRASGDTLGPPSGFHVDRPLLGAPGLGDMTGDGLPELIFVDADGKVWHSEATGG